MAKKKMVGVRLDYTKQFNQMQQDLRGSPADQKLDFYKSFYRQIAKTADARLLALERLSSKEGYENVKEWDLWHQRHIEASESNCFYKDRCKIYAKSIQKLNKQ